MSGDSSGASPPPRVRVAQGLALLALAASLIGALGPAERVRTTYSWPPTTLPAETPERLWYTPLHLAAHHAEAIDVTVPCVSAPALQGADRPTTILATARVPGRAGGLEVTLDGNLLELAVGGRVLDQVDVGAPSLNGRECAYRIRAANGRWALATDDDLLGDGALEQVPVVTGLFSELDLRAPGAPSAAVTTLVHATRTTTRQAVAWAVGALAAVGALLLVSIPGRPRRPWTVASGLVRGAWSHARLADGVVGAALALWWVLSPAHFDDGWVTARERMFEFSRGFSHYYSPFGINLPLDYWVEWAQHWLAQATPSLLWNRLPAVLCLGATWVLCRWLAVRILRPAGGSDGVPLWTLASVFVVGAAAWGVTLRPEPVTALLVTAVAACLLLFLERRSAAPLAVAAALVALAASAHPAGIVALAGVVVAAPSVLRWLRPNAAAATAIVAAALALLAVLVFVGSDLEQRRSDAQALRTYAFGESWRDEVTRYNLLAQHHYGTPLRRASVALMVLAVLAFALRRRRRPFTLLDYPAGVLAAGLLLLVAVPSKWPSHFGTLIGIAAVACCCEAARIRTGASRSESWALWPFLAAGAASGAVAWAWLEREEWNVADLRALDWTPGFESWLPVATLAALAPLLALGGALLVARARDRDHLPTVPWRAASWIGPLVAVPVLVFTTSMLVADAAKTSSWTLTRENLAWLGGRDVGCGLADDLTVPVRESARSLVLAQPGPRPTTPAWVPPAPADGLPRYALGPLPGGSAATPWFRLPPGGRLGLFVTGVPGAFDGLSLEWARSTAGGFREQRVDPLQATLDAMSGDAPWRFFGTTDLPTPPAEANAVRIRLVTDRAPGGALAVTAPVTYRSERLADRMADPGRRTLVHANLLLYLPCTRLPLLERGAVETPDELVAWRNPHGPFNYQVTSPFLGVADVYDLEGPFVEEDEPNVLVYSIDRRIPGAIEAPATSTTS